MVPKYKRLKLKLGSFERALAPIEHRSQKDLSVQNPHILKRLSAF